VPAPVPRVACPCLVPRAKGRDGRAYPRDSCRAPRASPRAPSPVPRASRRAAIHPLAIYPPVDRGRPRAPHRRRALRERAFIVVQQVDEHTCCNRMFHVFQMYIAYVLSGCCKSRSVVAYVAMTIHVCCKYMFQIFQLF